MLKGFTSFFGKFTSKYANVDYISKIFHQTISLDISGKTLSDSTQKFLSIIASGTLDATGNTDKYLKITANTIQLYDVIRISLAGFGNIEAQVIAKPDADTLILGTTLPAAPAGSESYSQLRYVTPQVDSSGAMVMTDSVLSLVDSTDDLGNGSGAGVIDTQNDQIPRSSNPPLQIVAALASDVRRIFATADLGEFIELYSDAAGTVKIATLNLTPDFSRNVFIPAGTSLYIRNVKDADIGLDPAGANSLVILDFMG